MCQRRSLSTRVAPNTAASESVKADACVDILMRQCKYLNNIVEQDHRAIKRITRAIPGCKSFLSARIIIAEIETMHMIRKGQMDCPDGKTMSAANQFYSLAVWSPVQRRNFFRPESAIATQPAVVH